MPAEATCHQIKPHTWSTRMHLHMCVHMQMFSTKLCVHPLKTPRLLNTGEGDYLEEEKWGLKVSGVLLRLVSSLWYKLQDLLSHWGHWAQRACKETHTQSMRHRTVFRVCWKVSFVAALSPAEVNPDTKVRWQPCNSPCNHGSQH